MAFIDAYPGGRLPVLAPFTWDADGWPHLESSTSWPSTIEYPLKPHAISHPFSMSGFGTHNLNPEWEWNHNPDNNRWHLDNELHLETASLTQDLYQARNTLTHRIVGPSSTATIQLTFSEMKDGDRAGLALFRDSSAWVGVVRDQNAFAVVMQDHLILDSAWNTTDTGREEARVPIVSNTIWLRAQADIRPGSGRIGSFSYSLDGEHYLSIGKAFLLKSDWPFFMGYRFAVFNYGTRELGGSVSVPRFSLTTP
jgi:beta-xylosidase